MRNQRPFLFPARGVLEVTHDSAIRNNDARSDAVQIILSGMYGPATRMNRSVKDWHQNVRLRLNREDELACYNTASRSTGDLEALRRFL